MTEKLPALKQLVCNSIDEAKDKLHLLGDAIWRHPELAYEERQAHETLVRFFTQEKGWTVEAHYKLETAFRATWGPVGGGDGEAVVNVGFLCEYDALPAIGHACGHNLIAESGAAAALGLKAALESVEAWPVPIKVTVLGTPAEEDEGGKVELLHEGAFEDLDVVFMAHPTQKNATYLPAMALHGLLVKYHGRASHASAYPWEGVNALDAAVMAYSNISVLRQQLKPGWRIHGIIKHGGVKPNIIPDYSELEFYLRTTSHRDLPIIRAKAEACFCAAAMATGCESRPSTASAVDFGENVCFCWMVNTNFIPDRSRPGLTTTAIGAVDLQGAGGNWATVGRRSRGGRRVRRQREKRKGKSVGLRIGTLNVGTMTGKGREMADMMERRKVDILCVQETRWKGSKARSIGAGFKLFYYGVDSKRNGVGVVLKEEFVRNVLEVKRVSDRVMSLKLEIEGVMLNVVSGYAPQVGCELEEKERFWSELDEVMESIPTGERVVIGADFNGHVGEGNTGDEEVMGKFGVKERNLEGQMVVDFAKRMDMGVVNTYFQKREEHRVTYKSGGRRTQVDYILCRRGNLKEISDCKVVVGESVARQHRMVVCRMTLMVCKKKRSKIEIEKKTKWWKLKKEECCEEFRQKLRQALGGQVVLPDDWETTAEVIRETGRKVLGVSSGRRKEDKETWWWNEEVQDSIQRKRLAKKKWDMDRTEENRQEYKELQRRVKREVSKAKQKAYDELYTRLDTREGEKDLYRLARQRDRDGKDVQQVRVIKDRDGRVLTSEESVQRRWKEYFEELMNEENERGKKGRRGELCGTENLEKAYDRVPREELWYCMRKSGVAEKYVRVVQDMYERSRTVVRCAVGQTEEFNVEVGLHQGSALSPFLFAIVMDQLSEEVRQESPWTMMFADDIVICSESREQVEENLERWRFALERRGMKVELVFEKNAFHELLRNRTLEDLYEENGKALGMKFTTEGFSGSTDFGNVSHAVPGIHPYFYIGSEALNHTEEYTAAAGADEAQFYTLRTAKALATTALDVIFSPGVLDRVKQEFREAKLR
ncbi:hypothetical protein QTP70_028370 [Hemibagrus guttatus]|uniref:Reverse transcriptase domain-containing protein n=1 Tax=Hemibagrus guttatus TaxID=175788 RepID=A0AAE0UJ90_9TELE|nr:hypothetical protein QTP70_028370 [Hemibagrus guttatus]